MISASSIYDPSFFNSLNTTVTPLIQRLLSPSAYPSVSLKFSGRSLASQLLDPYQQQTRLILSFKSSTTARTPATRCLLLDGLLQALLLLCWAQLGPPR